MRVDVLGAVAVSNDVGGRAVVVGGQALGGRRARIALVALALADGHVPGERLAAMIWGDEPPATWPVALRGVVRGLRTACDPLGGGEQRLIATGPAGYRLAAVEVDVERAAADVRRAAKLLGEGRHRAVLELAEPVSRLAGDQLLPGEDAGWLDPHRRAIDATALHASRLVVESAGLLGEHRVAVGTARRAVAAQPLDEGTHRALIAALDRAGDRAGAVGAYEDCRALLAEQLGVDPSGETVGVYLASLREQAPVSRARVPQITSSFLGRKPELAALGEALAVPGVVTVTGRGGVGKSRLAVQRTADRGAFAAAPLWVALASVTDDALVVATVALELGVPLDTEDTSAAIAAQLAPLGRQLLVLDCCEAVVDGAASLAATLVARAPMLTVLATSRVPLGVDGERVLRLAPLPEAEQVSLLVDRVREGGGELEAGDEEAALCRRSGGLPLALELLAAQLTAIPAGDLLDQLETAPDEGALRAIARSSYALLAVEEAALFRRLGVLDGSAGLPLVREAVSGGPIAPVRVVRILRELTARGLATVDRGGPRWRYRQDDDLHRFARELLAEDEGEQREAYGRLADAIRSRLPDDARAAPAPFAAEITDNLASIRSLFAAALAGLADLDRCRELGFRLHRYFATRNVDEGRFWLTRLLGEGKPGPWTPYATYALGYLSYWSGDTDDAMRDLRRAADLLDGARDGYRARALIFLAGLLDDVDRGTEAIEYVRLGIDAAAPFDVDLQVSAAMGVGSVLAERVDPSAAGYARDAIDLCRRGGSAEQLAAALPTAAMICWQVGALADARTYINEALPLHAGTKRIARVVLLSAAAGVCLADGDLEAAIEFGRTADEEAGELGVERETPLIRAVLARALLARGDLAGAARSCAGALTAAQAMTVEFPAAVGLETAALILHTAGVGDLGGILAAAGVIRNRGDRPASAPVADAIDALRVSVSAGPPLDTRAATAEALDRLSTLTT